MKYTLSLYNPFDPAKRDKDLIAALKLLVLLID